jgi:small-conductance mechanosensitive channel
MDVAIRPHFRRAVIAGIGAVIALVVGSTIGNGVHTPELHTKLIIIGLAIVFVVLGVLATRSTANELARVVSDRGGPAAGTTVRILITLIGYIVVALSLLGMLDVPLGHLLVGGAITGIVIGIAAQQSLGNIFAGLLLLLARPYVVGEEIRVNSGSLGGPFDGVVTGMDLLYTTLLTDEGPIRLPNAGLLAAAVGPRRSGSVDRQDDADRQPADDDSRS